MLLFKMNQKCLKNWIQTQLKTFKDCFWHPAVVTLRETLALSPSSANKNMCLQMNFKKSLVSNGFLKTTYLMQIASTFISTYYVT